MVPADRQVETPGPYCGEGNAPSNHVLVGRVVAVRGLRGEMRVALLNPEGDLFLRAHEVYMGDEHLAFSVRQVRLFKGQGLLQVEGVEDRTAAEYWRNAPVYVPAGEVAPLGEGEYYYRQIVGLLVVTEEGEELGRISDVLPTRANDVYAVQGASGEVLLPAIKEVIRKIDLDSGTMVVRLLDGLRD